MRKKPIRWTDKEIFKLIREQTPAKQIMEQTGISLMTLQKKYLEVVQTDKKFYASDGLLAGSKPARMTGLGNISIPKSQLRDASFVQGDEFEVAVSANKIVLTKKK